MSEPELSPAAARAIGEMCGGCHLLHLDAVVCSAGFELPEAVRASGDLAALVRERGPMRIATLEVTLDSMLLCHCLVGLDPDSRPVWLAVESVEHVRDSDSERAYRAALARASAPIIQSCGHTRYSGRIRGCDILAILGQLHQPVAESIQEESENE